MGTGLGLVLVRSFVLVLLLTVLLYHFLPPVELFCRERFNRLRDRVVLEYDRLTDFVHDTQYDVPELDRVPQETIAEFYARPRLERYYRQYGSQPQQGGPLLDGKSSFLPTRRVWRHGMVTLLSEREPDSNSLQ